MKEALEQWASAQASIHHHPTQQGLKDPSPNPHVESKPDNYRDIKNRYLRSLNIPIPMKKSNSQDNLMVAASAPIPIPISMSKKDSSDEEDEDARDSQEDEDFQPYSKNIPISRPKNFVPPHQMVDQGASVTINHSVPTNYRRRTRGI